MSDYYKLFEYCKKTVEINNRKKQQFLKNRESRLKKNLFNIIITSAYNKIKENAEEGFDYAVIYDGEYNKLIYELIDSLSLHFKPFNVMYKKKTETQRGFLEVLTDETNYVVIVDWKNKNEEEIIKKEKNEKFEKEIISNNISELPSKNIDKHNEQIEKHNEEIEEEIMNKNKENDNIIKKFGFETIF